MSITLHDVAAAAQVSIKTVSNVVRGQGNFSEATRLRVEEAIRELGYRPNVAARGLRSGRLGVIGLVVPDLRNPYFAELADEIIRLSAEHDLLVVIEQSSGDTTTELELLRGRGARLTDGVLFCVLGLADAPPALTESITQPVVILGEPVPGWSTDYVSMDHHEGVRSATAHLLAQGRTRIAVLGINQSGSSQLRLAGYREALRETSADVDEGLLVPVEFWNRGNGVTGTKRLLESGRHFDAMVSFNDALALGAVHALTEAGLAVPGDVAVVGFDGIEDAEYSTPALSTVRPDVRDIAAMAVQFLRERIDRGHTDPPRGHRAGCHLVVRASTAQLS